MTSLALVVLPVLAATLLVAPRVRGVAAQLLLGTSTVVCAVALRVAASPAHGALLGGVFQVDATARLFLAVINPIFLGVSGYVWNRISTTPELRPGMRRFAGLALSFLAAANAVLLAHHLLVAWVALEATTLAAAPLILRGTAIASVRASFRYLLFSSVALGLVLLGFSCLARGMHGAGFEPSFFLGRLPATQGEGGITCRHLGLGLVLLGLGTKLGLAPMYSWLPETYDEAPPAVAALLGAVQFNCSLVLLFRIVDAYRPGNAGIIAGALETMGIVSMVVSTFSIIATRNVKRLIAYASINHAGVIAIGLGIGKAASYGLLLYVLSNALIKAILLLTVGKIKAHYRTKDTRRIAGLISQLPYSGVFLMVGTFALLGFPPFGSFFGELLILSALVSSGHMMVFSAFCVLITMTFVATGRTIFPMIWGEPTEKHEWPRQTFLSASPKVVFLIALVILGIYIPPGVNDVIEDVAASLEAAP
jgi:hydrogenase-4 component F